jgi:hypothetical protein
LSKFFLGASAGIPARRPKATGKLTEQRSEYLDQENQTKRQSTES